MIQKVFFLTQNISLWYGSIKFCTISIKDKLFFAFTENCLWSEWEENWSSCSVTCGEGTRHKRRNMTQEASKNPPGEACVGPNNKMESCFANISCPGNALS